MTKNEDFRYLCVDLPGDIARRKAAGDLSGALRLVEARLAGDCEPELAARLRCERVRLQRLPRDYPYPRVQALELLRREWKDITDGQFDALVDAGRADWRYINGEMRLHGDFVDSLRIYPKEAVGLAPEAEDNTLRNQILARMEAEGSLTAVITLRAAIRSKQAPAGREVQAWLPIPLECPQQSGIEFLEMTPGGVCAPGDAPQRTVWWKSRERGDFSVTYRYCYRADYVSPASLTPDPVQPDFDTGEETPHLAFTPYLRALAARLTAGCRGPVEKAAAIYDYVTGHVDYRYQPAYLQLPPIADYCARELRGDCGVMALLFIALCRIAGVPARWESGLSVRPDHVGPHDWAQFYVQPYGWLWCDCSFGSSARRKGEDQRRAHYFGSLDPWRMVANRACLAPLTPPDPEVRWDPYDNQLGEMTLDGRGLTGDEMERTVELVEFQLL